MKKSFVAGVTPVSAGSIKTATSSIVAPAGVISGNSKTVAEGSDVKNTITDAVLYKNGVWQRENQDQGKKSSTAYVHAFSDGAGDIYKIVGRHQMFDSTGKWETSSNDAVITEI